MHDAEILLNLCEVTGRSDLVVDPRFPDPNTRAKNRASMSAELDATFRTRTTAEWLSAMNGLLPAALVYRLDQALDSDFAREAGMVSSVPHPGEGRAARPRQSPAHRRRAAGAVRLLTVRRRQRRIAGQEIMKLQGIKVVDLSWFLPGPYLTTSLADHGAEVIKVEPPGEGDPGRHILPPDERTSVFFRNMGRGKKSVVLDLKSEQGRADPFRLPARPMCWSNRFGPASPRASASATRRSRRKTPASSIARSAPRPGRRLSRPGRARSRAGGDDRRAELYPGRRRRPAIPGIPVADLVSGLHGLAGVLMALLRRKDTGRGDYIDVLDARIADGLLRQRGRHDLRREQGT